MSIVIFVFFGIDIPSICSAELGLGFREGLDIELYLKVPASSWPETDTAFSPTNELTDGNEIGGTFLDS